MRQHLFICNVWRWIWVQSPPSTDLNHSGNNTSTYWIKSNCIVFDAVAHAQFAWQGHAGRLCSEAPIAGTSINKNRQVPWSNKHVVVTILLPFSICYSVLQFPYAQISLIPSFLCSVHLIMIQLSVWFRPSNTIVCITGTTCWDT